MDDDEEYWAYGEENRVSSNERVFPNKSTESVHDQKHYEI
jgi:hypothetical protein